MRKIIDFIIRLTQRLIVASVFTMDIMVITDTITKWSLDWIHYVVFIAAAIGVIACVVILALIWAETSIDKHAEL